MKVGAKLESAVCSPNSPAITVSSSSPTPIRPASTSVTGLTIARDSHEGRGRKASFPSSFGVRHSTDSPTNETISTTAAAHANSHSGIGRSARPTSP